MAKKYDSILQSIITKLSKLLVPASKTSYGLMSPTDKTKLDDIKDEVSISDTEPAADSGVKLWVPSADDAISVPVISDDKISKEDTWSSEKINNMVSLIYPESRSYITDLPETPVVGDYFVSIADYWTSGKTQSFPYPFGLFSVRYGSYTGEYATTFYTTGDDHKIYYNTWRTGIGWEGWRSVTYKSDLPNPNILINPDFRINQRGKSSYAAGNWSVDGWLCYQSISAAVLDTGEIKLTSTAFNSEYWAFAQPVSLDKGAERLYGKTVTVSVYVSAITGSTDWILPSAEGLDKDLTLKVGLNTITETLTEANFGNRNGQQRFGIAFRTAVDGSTITIKYMKVEIGDTATPFIPPNPEEELLKCRERYQTFTGNLNPYQKTAANVMQFAIPAPHTADGTAFTAKFKDTTKFNVQGGVIIYNISGSPIPISMSNFALVIDPSVKNYYLNVPLPSNLSTLSVNDVLLSIGIDCPIEFTNE